VFALAEEGLPDGARAPPSGARAYTPHPCPTRASRAPVAGGVGEAEREDASVARGWGGEGADPEVPEGEASGEEAAGGGPRGGANPPRVPIKT
jgi:hypothetical protein